MNYKKINPWMALVLSFLTCGIYGLYWLYQICEAIGQIRGDNKNDFFKLFCLTIITCGIYGVYWYYQAQKVIYNYELKIGVPGTTDNGIIVVILAFFAQILVQLLFQLRLNEIMEYTEKQQYFNVNETNSDDLL